ncbi:hypothetical protein EDD86DRAFT_268357 [Gorgonomyces haynaldii]|nr:hypothetical protein EDD86DRAFT_268357 [Gorgonomyces haynaldii]
MQRVFMAFNFGQKPAQTGFGQNNLFGQPQSAPATGFGQPQSAPATGFGQTTQSTGFGQTAPAFGQPQTTQAPGFGQTQTTQAPAFGQPQPAGFGQTQTAGFGQQSNLFGQQKPATGFGQPSTTNLFGQPATTGLFGQTTQAPATSLFGQQPSNNLFGQTQPTTNLFGQQPTGGMFGQTAQIQPVPPSINLNAKYSDLSADEQKKIDEIDAYIQSQVQLCESLNNTDNGLEQVKEEANQVVTKLQSLQNYLTRDSFMIDHIKNQINQEARHFDLASRYIEAKKQGTNTVQYKGAPDQYLVYFLSFAKDLEQKMQTCRQTIDELDSNMRALLSRPKLTPKTLETILRSQHSAFLTVAAKVALIHDKMEQERKQFLEYREKFGSKHRIPGLSLDEPQVSFGSIAQQTLQPASNAPLPQQQQPAIVLPKPAPATFAPSLTLGKRSNSLGSSLPPKPFTLK